MVQKKLLVFIGEIEILSNHQLDLIFLNKISATPPHSTSQNQKDSL